MRMKYNRIWKSNIFSDMRYGNKKHALRAYV